MDDKFLRWLHRGLYYCFFAVFFVTPLLVYLKTFELFEYPKMMFVYAVTILIVSLWLLRSIREKTFTFVRTPLDIPLLLYVGATFLATIFSIDPHTSLYGYYSRFNGGLLSILAYAALYFAFMAEFGPKLSAEVDKKIDAIKPSLSSIIYKFLYSIEASTLLVSIYAVLERLGIDKDFWVQDVQSRVFSTFGQPNWLAAYLAMVIFLNLAFLFSAKTKKTFCIQLGLFILNYLGFTFTYSRGGTLGLLAGVAVFLFLTYKILLQNKRTVIGLTIFGLLTIVLFGNALIRTSQFQGIVNQKYPPEVKPETGESALDGPTDSSQIRLIVWRGAMQIFLHHPFLGTGTETFAYAYYQYRPTAHNQTSEWDFLYNKAHNEYLNELSTKGIVGFAAYALLIWVMVAVPYQLLRKLSRPKVTSMDKVKSTTSSKAKKAGTPLPSSVSEAENSATTQTILVCSGLIAAIASYLVQNFFGFSVVAINTLFFLFPGILFLLLATSLRDSSVVRTKRIELHLIGQPKFSIFAYFLVGIAAVSYLFILSRMWLADIAYASGYNEALSGYASSSYEDLYNAVNLNNDEPLYQSELGYVAAELAVEAQTDNKPSLRDELVQDAITYTKSALAISPKNTTFVRQAQQVYAALAEIDPKYNAESLEYAKQTFAISPTMPSDALTLARVYQTVHNDQAAQKYFALAVALKPDYKDARVSYAQFLLTKSASDSASQRETDLSTAKQELQYYLVHVASPDADIQDLLASVSAQQTP